MPSWPRHTKSAGMPSAAGGRAARRPPGVVATAGCAAAGRGPAGRSSGGGLRRSGSRPLRSAPGLWKQARAARAGSGVRRAVLVTGQRRSFGVCRLARSMRPSAFVLRAKASRVGTVDQWGISGLPPHGSTFEAQQTRPYGSGRISPSAWWAGRRLRRPNAVNGTPQHSVFRWDRAAHASR